MDRSVSRAGIILACIPHTRGDGPLSRSDFCNQPAYSPHAWGWTALHREMGRVEKVFPTRVGMDRVLHDTEIQKESIPHTRGDGPLRLVRGVD